MNLHQKEKKILIVCSDLIFSGQIRSFFKLKDERIKFIENPSEFRNALVKFHLILILFDLHHPSLGNKEAFSLIKEVRENPENRSAFAVSWGAHTESALLKSALEFGFNKAMPRSSFVKELPNLIKKTLLEFY
jgi:DNA-binding NarL/FixJ family response regulator